MRPTQVDWLLLCPIDNTIRQENFTAARDFRESAYVAGCAGSRHLAMPQRSRMVHAVLAASVVSQGNDSMEAYSAILIDD